MKRLRDFLMLLFWLALSYLAALIGQLATMPSLGDWYEGLVKPAWNPPDWVFMPVWTLLYTMMGVAAWLVWRADSRRPVRAALFAFAVQLVLNSTWSVLFFGLHNPAAAFAEILILWATIGTTTLLFWQPSRAASVLMMPYWAWVTFALFLNLAIWRLNPGG